MKIIFIILAFLTPAIPISGNNREIYIQAAKWKFDMPEELSFIDSSFSTKEELLPSNLGQRLAVTLFTIRVPSKGALAAYIWKDSLDDKQWMEYYNTQAVSYFNDVEQNDEPVFERSESIEKAGNGQFHLLRIKQLRKQSTDTISIYRYFRKDQDKVLHIIFEYSDSAVGKSFKKIISSSTFVE
jgi:hypothetical protein